MLKYKSKNKNIIFNVCAGQRINIKVLTKKIQDLFPRAKIKNIEANKADVYQTFGDNKKIIKELKIKNFYKINYGLKNTIKWFIKNKIFKLI